jgi:hypothetical protein
MPERIQLRRTKGWRKPAGAIVVARPTDWGNPWQIEVRNLGYEVIGPDDSRSSFDHKAEAAIAAVGAYQTWLVDSEFGYVEWLQPAQVEHLLALREQLLNDLSRLRGHDLACWCPLDQPCHADVLLELANQGALA